MHVDKTAAMLIKGIWKIPCLVYLLDGNIVGKKHICSCDHCLIENVHLCQHYKYLTILSTSDDIIDLSEDFGGGWEKSNEELSGDEDEHLEICWSCIFDAVEKESTKALF